MLEIVKDLYLHAQWPKGYYYSDLGQRDGLRFIHLQIGGMHRQKRKKIPVYESAAFEPRREIAGKGGLSGKRHVVGRKTINVDYGTDKLGFLVLGRLGDKASTLGVTPENPRLLNCLDALVLVIQRHHPSLAGPSPAPSPGALLAAAIQRRPSDAGSTSAKKMVQTRGPQLKTQAGLRVLREIRAQAIAHERPIPKRVIAMHDAGITDKTWRKYDVELWANWDRASYKPEKRD